MLIFEFFLSENYVLIKRNRTLLCFLVHFGHFVPMPYQIQKFVLIISSNFILLEYLKEALSLLVDYDFAL